MTSRNAESASSEPRGFELIPERYDYGNDSLTQVEHSDEKELQDLFMGHRVVEVKADHLLLDDGTVLRVIPNEGCGGCNSGWYELETLNRVDNIITKVEFDYQPTDDYDNVATDENEEGFYRIFVLAGDERINLLSVKGDDGNGYYGTGFHLVVRRG